MCEIFTQIQENVRRARLQFLVKWSSTDQSEVVRLFTEQSDFVTSQSDSLGLRLLHYFHAILQDFISIFVRLLAVTRIE